jgi:hypothetical protein
LRRWLLVCAAVALVASFAALHGIATTANAVRDRTSVALLEVASARQSLVDADQAAVSSYGSGEVALAGSGELYQRQMGATAQSLARVAEVNEAGNGGSRIVQVIEGLLSAYSGSIEQADAHFQQSDGSLLGASQLWYASRLLHMKDGALVQLDALGQAERTALHRQLSTGWMNPALLPLWAVPFVALFVLLLVAQRYLFHRFQRIVNIPLLIATGLLVPMSVGMAYSVVSQHRVHKAGVHLEHVLTDWHKATAATDAAGQRALAELMLHRCHQGVDCGRTVDGVVALLPSKPRGNVPSRHQIQSATAQVNRQLADADETSEFTVVIPAGALCIAVLVVLGLQPRLDEYRYRSRQ